MGVISRYEHVRTGSKAVRNVWPPGLYVQITVPSSMRANVAGS